MLTGRSVCWQQITVAVVRPSPAQHTRAHGPSAIPTSGADAKSTTSSSSSSSSSLPYLPTQVAQVPSSTPLAGCSLQCTNYHPLPPVTIPSPNASTAC